MVEIFGVDNEVCTEQCILRNRTCEIGYGKLRHYVDGDIRLTRCLYHFNQVRLRKLQKKLGSDLRYIPYHDLDFDMIDLIVDENGEEISGVKNIKKKFRFISSDIYKNMSNYWIYGFTGRGKTTTMFSLAFDIFSMRKNIGAFNAFPYINIDSFEYDLSDIGFRQLILIDDVVLSNESEKMFFSAFRKLDINNISFIFTSNKLPENVISDYRLIDRLKLKKILMASEKSLREL